MTRFHHHSPWFPYSQQKPQARVRLFCFPYAGGNAAIYHNWSELLPADIEICPIQLPGRATRLLEAPITQLSRLIEGLAQAMLPLLDLPYAFFGHSMGGLISFELAHYLLREQQAPPICLFVSGCRAPQIPPTEPPIHTLPDEKFLQKIRELNGTPDEILHQQEFLQLLLPILRADFAICETYAYTVRAPLPCPISAFGGLEDIDVPRNTLQAWNVQTKSTFKLRFFDGDHFFLHKAQASLLQAIRQDLFIYVSYAAYSRKWIR